MSIRELTREPDLTADPEAQMIEASAIAVFGHFTRRTFSDAARVWAAINEKTQRPQVAEKVKAEFREEQRAAEAARRQVGGGW